MISKYHDEIINKFIVNSSWIMINISSKFDIKSNTLNKFKEFDKNVEIILFHIKE